MGCVYKLLLPSGKAYIGCSINTASFRLSQHLSVASRGSKCAIHCAIRKYGASTVEMEILAKAESLADLLRLEKEAIEKHQTLSPYGYNLTTGGEGAIPSEETKLKISRINSENARKPGAREKRSIGAKKGNSSLKVREKISKALKVSLKALYPSGRPSPTTGMKMPKAAENGRQGAVKQSVFATGRKREYRSDGSWCWTYPLHLAA